MLNVQTKGIDAKLRNAQAGGKIPVGDNVYLEVTTKGKKVWKMRYLKPATGSKSIFVIGKYPTLTYKKAIVKAEEAKADVKKGIDPNDKKAISKVKLANKETSFQSVSHAWHDHRLNTLKKWTPGHAHKIMRSLELHVFPHIGAFPVDEVTPPMLLNIVERMQAAGKTEVTQKVNQRINAVFQFAILRKLLVINPANGLTTEIANPAVKHHPHIEPEGIPQFFHDLAACPSGDVLKIAVELTLRTLARTGEIRYSKWSEFDLDNAIWYPTPAHRKNNTAHIVPLPTQVVELLEKLRPLTGEGEYLFTTYNRNAPMSENAMLDVLKRMGWKGKVTIHGLRGTGSTALNEAGFRKDIVEAALSHKDKDVVRGAYNHAKYLQERREMLQWYSDYLDGLRDGAQIIPINRKRA